MPLSRLPASYSGWMNDGFIQGHCSLAFVPPRKDQAQLVASAQSASEQASEMKARCAGVEPAAHSAFAGVAGQEPLEPAAQPGRRPVEQQREEQRPFQRRQGAKRAADPFTFIVRREFAQSAPLS